MSFSWSPVREHTSSVVQLYSLLPCDWDGCGFDQTKKQIKMAPIASLLGPECLGLDLGRMVSSPDDCWVIPSPLLLTAPPQGTGSNAEDRFHILWDVT